MFYSQDDIIGKQLVSQLEQDFFSVPWGHHILIMQRCKDMNKALFYVRQVVENNWSRTVLDWQMDSNLYERQGKAISNFKNTLPAPQSDLAQQITKDPYNFDFFTIRQNYDEKELQEALTNNITKFLLELGNGFAYVGQQYRLKVGEQEFFADLLFYHLKLRCYVVIELKVERFKPEHLGQLGFYVTAIDKNMKSEVDNPTIGLLICKTKDSVVAEYALGATTLPIGISEYELKRVIPDEFKGSLPTIEEIEEKLGE